MKAPIAHYQHTERPIGMITKAEITDGLDIEVNIFEHCTDVWDEIEKGELNKFSIYGRRLETSPECDLKPSQRISPCITKALELWSISVVGNNAINESTYLEVVKSFNELYKNDNILIRAENTEESQFMHTVTDGEKVEEEDKKKKPEDEAEKCYTEKSGDGSLAHEPTNISNIMSRLDAAEKAIESLSKPAEEMEKGEETMEDKEKKEEEVEKCSDTTKKAEAIEVKADGVERVAVLKAEPILVKGEEFITKAQYEDIKKAYDDRFSKIEKAIEDMKKETIQKGGTVVVMTNELSKDDSALLGNLAAVKGV